jgi:hypothetical protein
MALSLGDAFLNFTAGAVERNNKIRDENVALALEDFKANKDLYQKIALDRYTRDSNKYDTEIAKMDSLKSVYSFIQDNNLDRDSASTLILSNSIPGFKNLDKKEQRRLINNTANSFKTNYKTVEGDATPDGVQTKQVEDGFEIIPEQLKLNRPNMKDYLQDPSFWTNLQNEIKTGTSGPLTNQVLKLLGKEDSSEGAKELLNNLEQKDGTVIKSEANVPSIKSKNQGIDTSGLKVLSEDDAFYVDKDSMPSDLNSIRNSYTGALTDGVKQKILSEFAEMSDKEINFYGEMKDGKFEVKDAGQYVLNRYESILKQIENQAWMKMLYTNDRRYYTEDVFLADFAKEVDSRSIAVTNRGDFDPFVGADGINGYFVVSTDMMPLGARLTQKQVNDLSEYINNSDAIQKMTGNITANENNIKGLVNKYFIDNGFVKVTDQGERTWTGKTDTTTVVDKQFIIRSDGKIEVNSAITTNIDGITIVPKLYSLEDFKKVKESNPSIVFPEEIEKLLSANPSSNNNNNNNTNNNNLENLIKKDKNTGVEYIPFG